MFVIVQRYISLTNMDAQPEVPPEIVCLFKSDFYGVFSDFRNSVILVVITLDGLFWNML